MMSYEANVRTDIFKEIRHDLTFLQLPSLGVLILTI